MEEFFEAAILNVYKHGDTDIFPFPVENRIIHDEKAKTVELLMTARAHFESHFARESPNDLKELVPVGRNGFRAAAQLDPFWNAYYLGLVLSVAEKIEDSRLGADMVFSYRLDRANYKSGDLFRRDVSWLDFYRASRSINEQNEGFVLVCDIADCYGRIGHHKLDNALRIINADDASRKQLRRYLTHLMGDRSSGLPVGGPASRILAELALGNVDALMHDAGYNFVRYADDYHVFCKSRSDAHRAILDLSRWLDNDGLILQRSKTRIMSKAEFAAQCTLILGEKGLAPSPTQRLMSLSLRYDPYSPNAVENYERLRTELEGIDILGLLNEQLNRTNIHVPTTRKLIAAIGHLDEASQYGAVLSLLGNMSNLHPIASSVLIVIARVFGGLTLDHREAVCEALRTLYNRHHEVMQVPLHVAFTVRIVGQLRNIRNQAFLHKCYEDQASTLVRREIIVVFANWTNFGWLSVQIKRFHTMDLWERRAAVLASYSMADEGDHWRKNHRDSLTAFEMIVRDWRASKGENFQISLT